ncbi:fimbrial protein, partial [Escherichia coli]|nr:fimbrial protein [Escherichia coli]
MKTKTGCMLLAGLMLTASGTTLAADNLHFYGNLLSKSCTLVVDG